MFNFRTEIDIPKYDFFINHNTAILLIGSCFSDNIGEYLKKYKFNVTTNPFGVLYNPASILNTLSLAANNIKLKKDDLIFDQDEYHSFYHHSSFSFNSEDVVLENINSTNEIINKLLPTLDLAIITYGTSIVYQYKETMSIVSNCHKIASNKFNKFMLSVEEIDDYIKKTINLLKSFNPKIKIIFTVSPVRHLKNGSIDNNLSKAKLFVAINNNIGKDIYYFPSYEIVNDDLRDYRFYKRDLVHPNELAIEYIWDKFANAFFDDETKQLNKEIEYIINALNHNPRNPHSDKHKAFMQTVNNKIKQLQEKYNYIVF